MSVTYYATEVSPEEYTATLEESAKLALADYESHIDEKDVRIGDIVKDDSTFYRVADIVDEQRYPSLIMLERLTLSGWKSTSIRFHKLKCPAKTEPKKTRWFLSGIPVGSLFKISNLDGATFMQRADDTDAGTLRARHLEGQFAGELVCMSKYSKVYSL